jgi:hypothetical protein
MSRRTSFLGVLLAFTMGGAVVAAATLKAESVNGWSLYVAAAERRMQGELRTQDRFLGMEFTQEAAADHKAVRAGEIVIRDVEARDASGRVIEVPSAMVHHWRGVVLIPRASLNDVFAWVRSGAADTGQEDVLQSAVLARGPDSLRMYLKLRRQKIVTAVYNTEHVVTFTSYSAARASSTSTATKIAELVDPGTPSEHELPPGQDRGFLWKWNAYWRYEQTDAGVLAECESISLSRDVPSFVGFMVRPIISSTARESMERTLAAMRTRLGR